MLAHFWASVKDGRPTFAQRLVFSGSHLLHALPVYSTNKQYTSNLPST